MDLDLVRDRHCVSVGTLVVSSCRTVKQGEAHLTPYVECPDGGVIALTTIQLESDFSV